jgi:hypothetical protein
MNKYIISGLAIIAGYLVYQGSKKSENNEVVDLLDNVPLPPAPQTQATADSQTYYTDQGEGKKAIESRMYALDRSEEKNNIIGIVDFYKGVSNFREDIKTVMSSLFGSAFDLPVLSFDLEPNYKTFLSAIPETENFEPLSQGGQVQKAISVWRSALTFRDFSFWPNNLADLIEQGYFKASGSADKDRSERYNAFTESMKPISENLMKASSSYTVNLRNRAIADLVASGWKFYGINQ